MTKDVTAIDEAGTKTVGALIDQVRAAGLTEAADAFSNAYWGWLRITSAYVNAHPYVRNPEKPYMTPISALTVVDYTMNHWAPLIPGSPMLDDDRVMKNADDDDRWHREEDRRMRRAAGEDI